MSVLKTVYLLISLNDGGKEMAAKYQITEFHSMV